MPLPYISAAEKTVPTVKTRNDLLILYLFFLSSLCLFQGKFRCKVPGTEKRRRHFSPWFNAAHRSYYTTLWVRYIAAKAEASAAAAFMFTDVKTL